MVVFKLKKNVGKLSEKVFFPCWAYTFRKVTKDLVNKEGRGHSAGQTEQQTKLWESDKGEAMSYAKSVLSDRRFQLKSYSIETHLEMPWLLHGSGRM